MAVKDRASARDAFKVLRTEELFEKTAPDSPGDKNTLQMLSLIDLYPFKNHPFRMYDEGKMEAMVKSVTEEGIHSPIIVRPYPGGDGYEIVCGHNRVEAAKRAMLSEIPGFVRDMDDETATKLMVKNNLLQREKLYPLEKAYAFKMMQEALLRKAGRVKNNGSHDETHLKARKTKDIVAEQFNESPAQVMRYIRLTFLTRELQEYVDDGKMGLLPAVSLSYLQPKEQDFLREVIEREETFPSPSQAIHLKNLSEKGELDYSAIRAILSQPKPQAACIMLNTNEISKYYPKSYTSQQISARVCRISEVWERVSRLYPKDFSPDVIDEQIIKTMEAVAKHRQERSETGRE